MKTLILTVILLASASPSPVRLRWLFQLNAAAAAIVIDDLRSAIEGLMATGAPSCCAGCHPRGGGYREQYDLSDVSGGDPAGRAVRRQPQIDQSMTAIT